jgi:tetratricopeptide (TPR) repeat protein
MPYVDGESLRDRLEREKQLPIEEAIRIAREVADGLGHAHRQGVVHRDIKPANVLLSDGHALIADFGVARAVDAEGQGLTRTGLAVGTPAYMSPEQASRAEDVDARSDLYALGCMLYEMLAGEPPLTGPTPQATAALRLTETATSLPVLRETVPGGLDSVVARSLSKSPADRYTTVEEFGEALAAPEVWAEAKPKRRIGRRVLDAVIAVVLLGAGVFLAQMFVGGGPTVELSENRIAVLPLVPTVRGDTALENLGHAVAARISANLERLGDIEAVSYQTIAANEAVVSASLEDAAHWAQDETGAARVAHGSLVRTGDEVSFEVNLLSSEDLGAVAQASFTAGPDDPRLLADSISWQILGQLWSAGEAPVKYYDHLIGRPFPAVRDFLIAESFYSKGWEVDKAVRALERAFRADPTLWVASILYEYFMNDYPGPEMPELDSTISNAHWQHTEDVSTPYREFVEAQRLFRERRYEERLDLYETVLAEHPGFWLVAMDYGNDLMFWGYLYGYTADDVIRAQADCVDANPNIIECWVKLVLLSQGKDAAALQRGYEYFDANLEQIPSSVYWPKAHQFLRLLMAYEEGEPPVALMDSVTRGLDWLRIGTTFPYGIWNGGIPQIFHDLHRRRQELSIDAEIPPAHLYWDPYAWAMRGAWDSTLVTLDRYMRESSDEMAPLKAFKLTALGEWLGGVPAGTSDRYLPGAAAFAERLEDPGDRATERAMLDYLQGVLAAARQNSEALRQADRQLEGIDHSVARTAQRALAAYALQLQGSVAEAADSLYEVTWGGVPPWYKRMIAINRLNASRWLLLAGDTARASKLLSSCQRSSLFIPEWDESRLLAGHCYLELARIEEARGRDGLARKYYWQFLKRYDSPVEALRPLVEEARAAYERVGGERHP